MKFIEAINLESILDLLEKEEESAPVPPKFGFHVGDIVVIVLRSLHKSILFSKVDRNFISKSFEIVSKVLFNF